MKKCAKNLILMPALMAVLALTTTGPMTAQTFTNLYSFTIRPNGFAPIGGLVLSGNILYGTTYGGGTNGDGTVFAVNTGGTDFTNLHSFNGSDGANPEAGLILSGNTLYGTTFAGGTNGNGTVFAVNADGTGFTNLYRFTATTGPYPGTNSDGANPEAGLILSGNTLYGTTYGGGSSGNGAVFAVNTNGRGFRNLYSFTATLNAPVYSGGTNNDGARPQAGMILSGGTLYGTTYEGGANSVGTVFAINTGGTGFTNLHSFAGYLSDGAGPQAGLILSGNTLYGTTSGGGTNDSGTVFAVNTDGTGFASLYSFTAFVSGINNDGAQPEAGLVLSGNTLYGTTYEGGTNGDGTVFAVNTDGTGFTTLHTLTETPPGLGVVQDPSQAGLILSGNTLYGTIGYGGNSGAGALFALGLVPSLSLTATNNQVILSWPTWAPSFGLQSTTNLDAPTVWNGVSPLPVIIGGQNIVTHPISGTQMFYRLYQSATTADGMALIPAGVFTMGDTLDGESDAIPTNVYLSAFYMDVNLVSSNQWQTVYNWATNHGYNFDAIIPTSARAANYPVESMDWYDAVKWCNARSQQAGLTPVYYTDPAMTQVYTNGDVAVTNANWSANGYRLPTEAEWEKAARGGLIGQRFPWGNSISETQANYFSSFLDSYNLGPYAGVNTNFDGAILWTDLRTFAEDNTSPLGFFAPNSYGLYDMAGNVFEWCWDWYATPYGQPTTNNPTGPETGSSRVLRGGNWLNHADNARCAYRVISAPNNIDVGVGFRCVRGL